MTKRELSKYYFLNLEIKDLKNQMHEIESSLIGSSKITGMPHGTDKSDPVYEKVELLSRLKTKLENREAKAMRELLKIESYISEIEDAEVRIIFSKRYIELKKWEVIAEELYMSESTIHRKHKKYLERNEEKC